MYIQNPENFEPEVLSEIEHIFQETSSDGKLIYPSFNTHDERLFINGIIRQLKPKKILEVGVAAGASSAIILNAIKDIEDAKLYSIDYLNKFWADNTKNIGYIVEEKLNHLTSKWFIYRGGVSAKFMEDIGNEIDFCFLDAAHHTPGEFLDFLMVLPFLKKNAVVMIHDILLPYVINYYLPGYYHELVNLEFYNEIVPNSILFALLKGKKITMNGPYFSFNNIGAVVLDDDIMEYIFDYFFILTLQWNYLPNDEDINNMTKLFSKYYDKKLLDIFLHVVEKNKKIFNDDIIKDVIDIKSIHHFINQNKDIINDKEKRLIEFLNSIAWWIPIRKWRDNFRNKILNG